MIRDRRWRAAALGVLLLIGLTGCAYDDASGIPSDQLNPPAGSGSGPRLTPLEVPTSIPHALSSALSSATHRPSTPPSSPVPTRPTPTSTPPTPAPSTTAPTTPVAGPSAPTTATPSGDATSPPALPDVGLPGVNDPNCRSDQPPVVLLHGTFSRPNTNFPQLAAALRGAGRCSYAIQYGTRFGWGGVGDIDDSAATVTAFIADVRAATRAPNVDVVAFSQGALVFRAAVQAELPSESIRLAIFLAPSYHGTSVSLANKVPAVLCPACTQQSRGSTLLTRLSYGGELNGQILYATLSFSGDEWVQPVADQGPSGPPSRVRTQLLDDLCPATAVDHVHFPTFGPVVNWTIAALQSGARPPAAISCG